MVEAILGGLADAGLIETSFPGVGSNTCDRNGNDKRSTRTQRAYLVFSPDGAEKVGITGGGTRKDGVPIRALRSMVQSKKALADFLGQFTGDLIVVVIKEVTGGPGVRADMLEFERKIAAYFRDNDAPFNAHCRP